jgi:hypothetical protein
MSARGEPANGAANGADAWNAQRGPARGPGSGAPRLCREWPRLCCADTGNGSGELSLRWELMVASCVDTENGQRRAVFARETGVMTCVRAGSGQRRAALMPETGGGELRPRSSRQCKVWRECTVRRGLRLPGYERRTGSAHRIGSADGTPKFGCGVCAEGHAVAIGRVTEGRAGDA